jgi:hypothetical protein
MGEPFCGHYYGFDVDPDMVQWTQEHFPAEHFTFRTVDMSRSLYNPQGSSNQPVRLDPSRNNREAGNADIARRGIRPDRHGLYHGEVCTMKGPLYTGDCWVGVEPSVV